MATRKVHVSTLHPYLGIAITALILAIATGCATSVPTEPPPVSLEFPTAAVPTNTPPPAPEVEISPRIEETTDQPPDLEATVQAMVSATVEAMQQPGPTPGATPAPNASESETTDEAGPTLQATQPGSESQAITPITATESDAIDATDATDSTEAAVPGEQASLTSLERAPEDVIPPTPSVEPTPEPALPTVTPTPAPTATPDPTATPAPTPTELPKGSSWNNPVPLGQKGIVQDYRNHWELSVVNITPDAWDIIQEENRFNKPPGEGKQYYMLRLRVKNVGEQRGFFVDYVKTTGRAVGWVYTTSGDSCGVYPDSNSREVFPGGEFELNVCWHVATDDLPTLVMFWDESPTPNPVWFDLR